MEVEVKDKKKHILLSAEHLFAVKGFEASTVRDIADAAGVNLAMISYYFGSKEGLMEYLFHERMDATKIKVEQLLQNNNITPFEKVEIMLGEYITKVIQNQSFYKILVCEQIMNKNKTILKLLKELKMGYAAMFTELVKEGQKKKVFKKNVDVVLALNTMIGTVIQFVINKEHYVAFNNIKTTDKDFNVMMQTTLHTHLKEVFKTILGYES
jgi:AcrR family transcriptional regulator